VTEDADMRFEASSHFAASQFAPSWFIGDEGPAGSGHSESRQRGFIRLWRAFMRARVFIALVVLALEVFVVVNNTGGPDWLVLLSSLHLAAALAVLLWMRPVGIGPALRVQWLATIGVDLVVFAVLQYFQQGSINFTPLFALPVLLASILGTLLLGLGSAAFVTLYLLAETATNAGLVGDASTSRFLQAGLTGTGFFLVAILAHQLALRLAREEAVAQSSQAAARTQAQVNELVIASLSEGVLVADTHGVVRNANPAALEMLMGDGHPPNPRLLLSARPGWESLAELVNQTFLLGHPMEAELRVDIDELTRHRLYARTRLTATGGKHHTGLCVLFLEDLREVEARVRTEKLASMGRMSAAVAHEIRNPLSAITQANALLDEEVADPAQKRLTRMIEQNAQRLSRIVDDILNVARAQPSQGDTSALTPLDAVVRQITQEWTRQVQAGPALGVHLHAPGSHVGFDPEHLRRLLVNLLDNARRHASGQPASIRVITQPAGTERIRLSVWSDGLPLEASVLKHLFEPFFSSESRSSGLGLYICRELCERYGAQIAYQRSVLDQREGNEFYVLMPSGAPSQRQPAQQSLAYPPADSQPPRSRPMLSRPSELPPSPPPTP